MQRPSFLLWMLQAIKSCAVWSPWNEATNISICVKHPTNTLSCPVLAALPTIRFVVTVRDGLGHANDFDVDRGRASATKVQFYR